MFTLYCLDCGHAHELAIVRGETPADDYIADAPDTCENCGESLSDDIAPSDDAARATERRQMGITN